MDTLSFLVATQTFVWIWAIIATSLVVFRHYIFDDGHRLYGVPSEKAREIVGKLLKKCNAGQPLVAFELGPAEKCLSRQTVLSDGTTVLHLLDKDCRSIFPATGLSCPTSDPVGTAQKAQQFLAEHGFESSIWIPPENIAPKNSMAIVTSNAFDGWTLSFRKSTIRMIPHWKKFIHPCT